jgi:hypothetical protein
MDSYDQNLIESRVIKDDEMTFLRSVVSKITGMNSIDYDSNYVSLVIYSNNTL